jgi:hypothetical protein
LRLCVLASLRETAFDFFFYAAFSRM